MATESEMYELDKVNRPSSNAKATFIEYVMTNQNDKICKFVKSHGTTILNEIYGEPYCKPILYIACDDLARTVSAETVETLINLGADMYYSDNSTENKEAIHVAVSGNNPDILRVVIKKIKAIETPDEALCRINSTAYGSTALCLLVKDDDAEDRVECLNILLEAGVDVNKADKKNHTPILWASYEGYKSIVTAILNNGKDVNIDDCQYLHKTARTYIEEKGLYDKPLPLKTWDKNENNVASTIQENAIQEDTPLQRATELNQIKKIMSLLEDGADVFGITKKNNKIPLLLAAQKGYHNIFKLLLAANSEVREDILVNILTDLLKRINQKPYGDVNHEECVKILLRQKENLPVNVRSDTGNTPLHYTCAYSNKEITLELLKKGASLANSNAYRSFPVEDIDPRTLRKHFDSCIKIKEQPSSDKQSVVVEFDYTTLLPTDITKKHNRTEPSESVKDVEKHLVESQYSTKTIDPIRVTDVVHVMSRVPEMHELLSHPLISSFIYITWYRMMFFFWLNLAVFAIFCLSLITYVFIPEDKNTLEDYKKVSIWIVWIVLVFTYFLLVFRELLQLLLSMRTYFCRLSNILEIIMLLVCIEVIFHKSDEVFYKQASSLAMVLIALEIMVILGQHPKMSTNIVILRTVTKDFFLFLCWYAVLIVAFVLCFYKLFSNTNVNPSNSTISSNEEKKEEEQNFFGDIYLTFIKTIVMLTGELDAGSLNLDNTWNRLIFVMFVFLIPIILLNLLNGLAVSDTQIIKDNAELTGFLERINYIVYIEAIILGREPHDDACWLSPDTCECGQYNWWRKLLIPNSLIRHISLESHYLQNNKMEILLYYDGKIIQHNHSEHNGCSLQCVRFWKFLQRQGWFLPCFTFCIDLHLDKKTINRVKELLYKKNNELDENREIKRLNEIIECQRELIQQLKDSKS